jgi:hypothetical protein
MSWDDKRFMQRGLRVRHKYSYRRGCHPVCERCGVQRRRTTSGWEYRDCASKTWSSSNPPCAPKERGEDRLQRLAPKG